MPLPPDPLPSACLDCAGFGDLNVGPNPLHRILCQSCRGYGTVRCTYCRDEATTTAEGDPACAPCAAVAIRARDESTVTGSRLWLERTQGEREAIAEADTERAPAMAVAS